MAWLKSDRTGNQAFMEAQQRAMNAFDEKCAIPLARAHTTAAAVAMAMAMEPAPPAPAPALALAWAPVPGRVQK